MLNGALCLQVVYSPSARELKMEMVKADAPEKEEDDIDIDAIWDSEEDAVFFFFRAVALTHDALCNLKRLAFPLLYSPSPPRPSPPLVPTRNPPLRGMT